MPRSRATSHFTAELFRFLRDLDRHNERAWFELHKPRYLEHVRDPMLSFITDFAARLERISRRFVADPRPTGGSMFRIYRDVRFGGDKRPYKTVASAQFRHEAGRDVHAPGFYLHLEPGRVFVGGGIWRPDGSALAKIRDGIVADAARWKRITRPAALGDGIELAGEVLKRPPRGYDPDHPLVADLRRKDFVAVANLDEDAACSADFIERVTSLFRRKAPFVRFLTEALELDW
jgi:uncharacterized protein (TIGR02453 family)